MIRTSAVGLLLLGTASLIRAGEAAFSDDAKTVYMIQAENGLNTIDLSSEKVSPIAPEGVGKINAIARAPGGNFLLVSANALWTWKPGAGPAISLEKAPEGASFGDVACSDDGRQIAVFGTLQRDHETEPRIFYRPEPGMKFLSIRPRHLTESRLCAPAFLTDGTLLFSADGDLWHGILEHEADEDGAGNPILRGTLTAYRYAPIAERYAYPGTPAQQGVQDIAYGAGRIFVHISRMGGSGWGHLSPLAAPAPQPTGTFETHNTVEDAIQVMKSVHSLLDTNGSQTSLCSSPDRTSVHMQSPKGTHFLAKEGIEDGGPMPIRSK